MLGPATVWLVVAARATVRLRTARQAINLIRLDDELLARRDRPCLRGVGLSADGKGVGEAAAGRVSTCAERLCRARWRRPEIHVTASVDGACERRGAASPG